MVVRNKERTAGLESLYGDSAYVILEADSVSEEKARGLATTPTPYPPPAPPQFPDAMLAAERRQTPRPRPPAQIRRSASKGLASSDGAPPPPYALEFPALPELDDDGVSDPVTATAKLMGIQLETGLDMPTVTEEEVSQKSREELTELILQAERIIRARSTELAVAANLGKNLLETNEALKLRHDALLSRLPAMQSPTSNVPSSSSTPFPKGPRTDSWATDDDVPSPTPSRTSSRTNSIISSLRSPVHSRTNSLASNSTTPARRGHVHRISASPSALLALSETNSELIAELTRLRSATDSEQVDGARRLRKLEREIGGLKAALDTSQRVNAELEERVREQQGEERRREREERLKKLRASDVHEQSHGQEIRDFAPQGHGVETWDSVGTPRMATQDHVSSDASQHSDSDPEYAHSDGDASVSSAASSRPPSQYNTITPGEYAVVAQLYSKVEELQQANAELGARNRVTNEQLARAEREALEIKRVYDEIGEEMGADADAEQSEDDGEAVTIKAISRSSSACMSPPRSLRSPRSSRSSTPKASSWSVRGQAFDDPFMDDMSKRRKGGTGTRRALGNKHMYQASRTLKSRKPLTDALFAPPSTPHEEPKGLTPSIVLVPSRSPRPRSKLKGKFRPKAKAAPFLSSVPPRRKFSASSFMTNGSASGMSIAPSTSASSFISASGSSFASPVHYRGRNGGRSLGSELGDEFGADWGLAADMPGYSNLFDDGSFRLQSEGDDGEYEDEEDDHEDPALAALRDALNAPYAGRLLEPDEHILPVGSLQASPGEAFQLVAHAVAARPNRWLESDDKRIRDAGPRASITTFATRGSGAEDPWETTRYPDIEPEDEKDTVRMRRRDRALERMASTSTRRMSHSGGDAFELVPSASQLQTADYYPARNRSRELVEKIKRTSSDALIELWIFLQFVVVICTFLYTMSRRGPREVLGAPRRRA